MIARVYFILNAHLKFLLAILTSLPASSFNRFLPYAGSRPPRGSLLKNLSLTATNQSSQEEASWKKDHSHIAGPELSATQKAPEPSNCLLRPSVSVGRVLALVETFL